MGLLGLRQSESRIDHWIVWELTLINRLRFSDIDLFTDCSPAQPILQTAPVTTQCTCSPWTSGRKKHRGPVCYNSMIKIDVFCIKIHLIYYKMAWIMSHHGEKPVWCQQVSQQSSRMDFTLRLPIGRRKHLMIKILTNPMCNVWHLNFTSDLADVISWRLVNEVFLPPCWRHAHFGFAHHQQPLRWLKPFLKHWYVKLYELIALHTLKWINVIKLGHFVWNIIYCLIRIKFKDRWVVFFIYDSFCWTKSPTAAGVGSRNDAM